MSSVKSETTEQFAAPWKLQSAAGWREMKLTNYHLKIEVGGADFLPRYATFLKNEAGVQCSEMSGTLLLYSRLSNSPSHYFFLFLSVFFHNTPFHPLLSLPFKSKHVNKKATWKWTCKAHSPLSVCNTLSHSIVFISLPIPFFPSTFRWIRKTLCFSLSEESMSSGQSLSDTQSTPATSCNLAFFLSLNIAHGFSHTSSDSFSLSFPLFWYLSPYLSWYFTNIKAARTGWDFEVETVLFLQPEFPMTRASCHQ